MVWQCVQRRVQANAQAAAKGSRPSSKALQERLPELLYHEVLEVLVWAAPGAWGA